MTNHHRSRLIVANLRAVQQQKKLSQEIVAVGHDVIEFPTLNIEACAWTFPEPSNRCFDYIVFISINAVDFFIKGMNDSIRQCLQDAQIVAIGPATSARLIENNIDVDIVANPHSAQGLLSSHTFHNVRHKNILIIKGQQGSTTLHQILLQRQAKVTSVDCYARKCPTYEETEVRHFVKVNPDVIVVTSVEALQNLHAILGPKQWPHLQGCTYLCASDRIANQAKHLGLNHIILSAKPTTDSIISCLKQWAKKQ